jgi:hypothetical protein
MAVIPVSCKVNNIPVTPCRVGLIASPYATKSSLRYVRKQGHAYCQLSVLILTHKLATCLITTVFNDWLRHMSENVPIRVTWPDNPYRL